MVRGQSKRNQPRSQSSTAAEVRGEPEEWGAWGPREENTGDLPGNTHKLFPKVNAL